MDNVAQAFLAKEEAKNKARINGFIDEGLQANASGDHSVDWQKVKTAYTSGEMQDNDVHELHNYSTKVKAQALPKQPVEKPVNKTSTGMDIARQVVAGVANAGIEEAKFMNEATQWIQDNTFNLRNLSSPWMLSLQPQSVALSATLALGRMATGTTSKETEKSLSKFAEDNIPKAETTAGAIAGTISQFMTGMVGFSKYLKGAKGVEAMGRSATASAVVSGTAMNPDDSLVVHALNSLHPEIKSEVNGMLLAPDSDMPQMQKRLIAAVEGYGLSWATDGLIASVKGLRNVYKARGSNVSEVVAKAEAKAATTEAVTATPQATVPKVRTAKELQTIVANREAAIAGQKESARLSEKFSVPPEAAGNGGAVLSETERQAALASPAKLADQPVPNHAEGWLNARLAAQEADQAISHEIHNAASASEAEGLLKANEPHTINTADELANASEGERVLGKRSEVTANPLSIEEATAHLKAITPEVEKVNQSIIKIESGKSINVAERKALVQEVAERAEALNAAGVKAVKSGNKELVNSGIISPEGVIDFAKYAEQRGLGDIGIAQKLTQIALGGTKQEIGGSIAGALSNPAILLADDNTSTEADKQANMDKFLAGALFILAGRFGAKAFFKGTKGAEVLTAREAAEAGAKKAIIDAETKVAQALPKSISPLVTASTIKAVPRVMPNKVKTLSEALTSGDEGAIRDARSEVFNFDHIETSEDVEALINETAQAFSSETERATRGVVTHAETEKLAEDLGTSVNDLKTLYADTSMLAERVTAARNLLPAAAEKTYELAKSVMGMGNLDKTAKDAAILALRKQVAVQAAIQMKLKGSQTEIARALSAMRIRSSSDKLVLNEMNDLVEAFGGRQVNEDFAKGLMDIYERGDSAATNRFLRSTALAKSTDVIKSYWYSSVLSGLGTHGANIVSNMMNVVEGTWERTLQVAIGKAFGTKGAEHYAATDYVKGVALGSRIAVGIVSREFPMLEAGTVKRAFTENAPVLDRFGGTKIDGTLSQGLEAANPYAISSAAQGVNADSALGKLLDLSGKYVFSVPGRALVAEDEFFKSVNYYGHLHQTVAAEARAKGLVGKDFEDYVGRNLLEPSVENHTAAIKSAREGTFTSDLGKVGEKIQSFARIPGMFLIMPFVRTPMNILNHFAERMPVLGLLMENNRAMMTAGGMQRDLVMAKQATGALYIMGATALASNGLITGSGVLDKRKGAENLANIPAYSIKVGDTYYSYNRLDPMGYFLGLTADWHEFMAGQATEGEKKQFQGAALAILAKFMESKTYIQGLANIMDIISQAGRTGGDSQKAIEKFKGQLAGSFYPSLLAGANKSYGDPHTKEFWEWQDKVKERIFGLSGEVYNQRNIFGQEQVLEGGVGADIVSPIAVRTENPSVAAKEIARLNVDMNKPAKKIGNVELTAKQYDSLMAHYGDVKISGKTFEEALIAKMNSPKWETMSESRGGYDGAKEEFIKRTYARYTRAVKHQFQKENPDVIAEVRKDKSNPVLAREGLELFQVNHADPYSDSEE